MFINLRICTNFWLKIGVNWLKLPVLHGLSNVIHQLEFPAFAANGGTIFSGRDFRTTLLIRLQGGETMGGADFIVEFSQMEQCIGMLSQFQAVLKADRVDRKVGMDVVGIAMGSHQHFISRPCLGCKLQGDLMGLLAADGFFRGKGLHILVKADAVLFAPCGLGGFKLCDGAQSIAVDASDETNTGFFIPGLLLPHAVIHDPLHITGPLPDLLDIGDGRQSITPANAPDFLIDGSLQIDDLLKVVGVENSGIDLGGDLIQVIADALQFRHQGSGIFRYIDLGFLCGSDQEIGHAHTGAEHLFHDGIVLLLR